MIAPTVAVLVGVVGCGEELGRTRSPTAEAAGQVVIAGQPVTSGFIEFLPSDGAVGLLRSARLRPDGRFRAEGVAVGTNAIRVVGAPLPASMAARFSQAYLIRRDIPPEGADDLLIDLSRE